MKIESKLIKDLKPATYNPRQISTKQYNDLKASVKKFGLVDPIIVNKDNTVVGGHQRLKICKELKHIEIDCVVLDLSKEEERELNIRLNKNTGTFDIDILANEFDIDELVDWGFKHIDLDINIDKITEGNTEDDHIPEVKESKVKLGDVWELGKHRLMCGDSTKESDVEKLMNGEKADMVFTDPPYGMGYKSNGWDSDKTNSIGFKNNEIILGDENISVGTDAIRMCNKFIKKNVHLFFWCRWDSFYEFSKAASEFSKVKGNIVWDKGDAPGLGDLECSFGGNEMAVHSIVGRRKLKKRINSVWQSNRLKGLSMVHPTQKPIEIINPAIHNCTKISDLIIDLFLGSGSTLIACEKTNRICYGMELDTKYCDVIIERWEQFTGQKAIKL